jgi:hypothetical protein
VLSSHFSPGAAPQVGQRTASNCFGLSSFFIASPMCRGQLDRLRGTQSRRTESADTFNLRRFSLVYALLTTDMGRFCRKALIRALFICKPPL